MSKKQESKKKEPEYEKSEVDFLKEEIECLEEQLCDCRSQNFMLKHIISLMGKVIDE